MFFVGSLEPPINFECLDLPFLCIMVFRSRANESQHCRRVGNKEDLRRLSLCDCFEYFENSRFGCLHLSSDSRTIREQRLEHYFAHINIACNKYIKQIFLVSSPETTVNRDFPDRHFFASWSSIFDLMNRSIVFVSQTKRI